jgi:hypothetical protein
MDNAYVTWKGVTLANNSAAFSVFDLWFGDAWIEGADVMGNHVQAGSVWNFESFRGKFQEVSWCGRGQGWQSRCGWHIVMHVPHHKLGMPVVTDNAAPTT